MSATDAPRQNLNTFTDLKILSIQSNRITKMQGLDALVNLEELYLSHNGLTKIEGLEHNVGVASECLPTTDNLSAQAPHARRRQQRDRGD